MQSAEIAVREFHAKYGFHLDERLTGDRSLRVAHETLSTMAAGLSGHGGAEALRAHLIVEEVSELLEAMATGDRVGVLDALADLAYVTIGTAVTFGLPLAAAFSEVHRSNMTKTTERGRPGHPGKGAGYSPPDLGRLLTAREER